MNLAPFDQARMEKEYFPNHKTFGYLNIKYYFTLEQLVKKKINEFLK